MTPQSVEEFEEGYAKRSGMTVEELHKYGLYGLPCDCGEEGCMGWRMAHQATEHFRIKEGEA